MRILLVRLRQIGDVVFTTPAVRAIHEHFPDAILSYIVEPSAAPIVVHNPHLAGSHRGSEAPGVAGPDRRPGAGQTLAGEPLRSGDRFPRRPPSLPADLAERRAAPDRLPDRRTKLDVHDADRKAPRAAPSAFRRESVGPARAARHCAARPLAFSRRDAGRRRRRRSGRRSPGPCRRRRRRSIDRHPCERRAIRSGGGRRRRSSNWPLRWPPQTRGGASSSRQDRPSVTRPIG